MSTESHGVETYQRAPSTTLSDDRCVVGTPGCMICTPVTIHTTFLPSQGCTAVSVDTCIALARFPEAYPRMGWSTPGFSKNPYPYPPKPVPLGTGTGFRGYGYG